MKTRVFLFAFTIATVLIQKAHAQDTGTQPVVQVAMEDDPTIAEAEALNDAAKVAFRQAHLQFLQVLAKFDAAISKAPNDPRMHFNRARVLERLGRTSEAQEALRRYLTLAGNADDRNKVEADILRLDQDLTGEVKPPTPAVPMSLMGRLEIRVRVDPGAKPPLVAINGDRIETLGGKPNQPLSLPPGSYYVLVWSQTGRTEGMVEVRKGELTPFVVHDPPPHPVDASDTLARFPP